MEKKRTTDVETCNRIIAEFMGGKVYGILETGNNPMKAYYDVDKIKVFEAKGYNTQLSYHTSWDWLVPVVEKIESLYCNVNIINKFCQIIKFKSGGDGEIDYTKSTTLANTKIENVWLAVVEFITWYNQNQLK